MSKFLYFVDANIFLEVELEDARKEECKRFLKTVILGEERALTSDFILYSVLLELVRKSTLKRAKDFLTFLEALENLEIYRPTLKAIFVAINKMKEYNLNFDDALIVACMLTNKITKLVSFDKHFDKVREIKRVEP